jgi:hypothetical protein
MLRASGLIAPVVVLTALVLLQAGCLVQGHCTQHADCEGNESCNSGLCELACTADVDCLKKGMLCIKNKCEPPLDKRILAQNFCLNVENPEAKAYYNKQLCLEQLKGKVVLIFFGAYLG